ncbi:MAG TPA: 5'/3'-nucleotidase SurE [Bacteroidia bacterium]|nr:5'/3'-nucleotidase SurE [Bacteroidia bacterium]
MPNKKSVKKHRPQILIVNDDGITSRGIKILIEVASQFGDVHVVAPDKPQSGMGHAITVHAGITVSPFHYEGTKSAYSCTGTPADCVKIAIYHLLKEKPDLCLSGINHGSNASLNVIYSGTMSAALEGSLEGIPSAGISFCNNHVDADMKASAKTARTIIEMMLSNKTDENLCLDVNIPDIPIEKVRGIKFCRQAKGNWHESYEPHKDKEGNEFLWLSGEFENLEKSKKDTDLWALDNGYVSIVPINADMTAYNELDKIKGWKTIWK